MIKKAILAGILLLFSLSSFSKDNKTETENSSKTQESSDETISDAIGSAIVGVTEAMLKELVEALEKGIVSINCADELSPAQLEGKECISHEQLSKTLICVNSYAKFDGNDVMSPRALAEEIKQESQTACATGYLCGCEKNKTLSSVEQ